MKSPTAEVLNQRTFLYLLDGLEAQIALNKINLKENFAVILHCGSTTSTHRQTSKTLGLTSHKRQILYHSIFIITFPLFNSVQVFQLFLNIVFWLSTPCRYKIELQLLELQVEKLFDILMFRFVRLKRILEIDGTSGHIKI